MKGRVDRVLEVTKGERKCVEAFVRENEEQISQMCEASWCLRLVSVSCKEKSSSANVIRVLKEKLTVLRVC